MAFFLFIAILLCATDSLWAGEICCPGLRCYDDSQPFDGLPLPQCPEAMSMSMQVYTRQNLIFGRDISRTSIPSVYKRDVMTVFIVHGWWESELSIWMLLLKDAFLKKGDYNVIVVGWKGGSKNLWYPQSSSNTRTVGGEIALVANNTINKGYTSKDLMYCIGASLGAHVCGHAGQQGQFGRITGLDPAGPVFEDRDWAVGLNPSSAHLVDAIHTDGRTSASFGLGTMKRLGHIDFYPNGGARQPSCSLPPEGEPPVSDNIFTSTVNTVADVLRYIDACSHAMSATYFIESINSPCFLSRYSCEDQAQLPGSCTKSSEAVQSMGFSANTYPARGIFYLETNMIPPFCRG